MSRSHAITAAIVEEAARPSVESLFDRLRDSLSRPGLCAPPPAPPVESDPGYFTGSGRVLVHDPDELFKQCSCGCSYTRGQWEGLHYVGRQADPEETLELRNCPCGSTMAVVL
jgi:hypothetical protein